MDVRLLGPVEVSVEERPVAIGASKPRALLAMLALRAGSLVSVERLIDGLWGDQPPVSASKLVQLYVSQLRKALAAAGDGAAIVTRGHGYELRVRADEVDVGRFERLATAGRPREALALWRGPPLADLADQPFAAVEARRLEELRLAAIEDAVERDLRAGRHAQVAGELEALSVEEPLRERLHAQRMLALYRSGRQADALEVYRRARSALIDAIGAEPGPELQRLHESILRQAPSLDLPSEEPVDLPAQLQARTPMAGREPELARPREHRRFAAERRSPSRYLRAVVYAGTLALVALAAVMILPAHDSGGGAVAAGSSAGAYDPVTGELLRRVPLGTAPSTVAAGERGVWVLDRDDKTVARIDPSADTVARTFSTASIPTDLAVGAGAIWVGNGFREPGLNGTFLPESVSRIDPETTDVVATIPLHRGRAGPYVQGDAIVQQHIAVSEDAVWAINPDLTVSRIDPRVNRVVARITEVKALTIAAGEGRVWIVDDGGSVAEIDPRANRVVRRYEVPTESLTALAVGAGAVWVANTLGGSVWRIDPGPKLLLHEIPLALGVGDVAFGAGSVWATNEIAGKVYRIDPRTNRARTVSRIAAPRGVAFAAGTVWVTAGGPPSPDEALPASACGRVLSGGGSGSQLLLVSNLPLSGSWRDATLPMVEAIRYVLKRRGFKAGRFQVGYQSCDESTARAQGFEFYRCYANAKAFARKPNVIGVIGAHSSFCSNYQIPIASQAPGGPLAMISPSNTWTGLTRPYRGMRSGELEARYPTGERNYVRIAAADHLQAVADAELARQLGSKRLFVLSYGDEPYLAGFAADVRTAARNLGLEIAGHAAWNPDARHFGRLARRIGEARADAVFIGGHLLPNGGRLVRDVRARLGQSVDLIATDYFWTIPDLTTAAGPAAEGTYVSVFGVPNGELPRDGKRFLADFKATRGGDPGPSFAAAYAAQAAEIMLDSIARSDGTRASVTRELHRTRIDDGILGDIGFDEYGDLEEGPFTILRVTRGAQRNELVLPQFEGAVVDRVIRARPGLLR